MYGDKPAVVCLQSDGRVASPEANSCFFTIVSYAWIDPLIMFSYKNGLNLSDIWGLRVDDFAYPVLMKYYHTFQNHRFTIRLFNQFKTELLLQGLYTGVQACLVFLPTLCLKKLLEFIEDPDSVGVNVAWLMSFFMLALNVLSACFEGRGLFLGKRIGLRIRALIIGEIYSKALRKSFLRSSSSEDDDETTGNSTDENNNNDTDESTTTTETKPRDVGSIINLMSVDAFKVADITGYLSQFISAIIMTIIATTLLYKLLGWPAIAGGVTMIIFLPVNYKVGASLGSYQQSMLKLTDSRIQKLNELLQNIRIVKFFAWENKFGTDIIQVRDDELYYLKWRCIVWVFACFVWFLSPTLISFTGFYCYAVVRGKRLTPSVAFTALSLFNLLRTPLEQFASLLAFVVQSKVSLDRVEEFLNEPESTKYDQLSTSTSTTDSNSPVLGFTDASFAWNAKNSADFKLRDINISFKLGQLNVITGSTGSETNFKLTLRQA
ncbi:unnamed protein product [Ambrosiozyma monospora]|uniref:Unnamed protein product n=1 Tax=Ambrosiozyma monospora TaxID=43982 RepID=A0ACB5T6K8_AMBMO|nr:unnamed protein product [Ambrosiozyma monospora]